MTEIPGNLNLGDAERCQREAEILLPYHQAIESEIDRRQAVGQETVVIALHSFTPVYMGMARPWHAGVLHDRNPGFALALGQALRQATGQMIGDNEPYRLTDASDFTVPHHAEARNLPYVELEIRQDLIDEEAGQRRWAELLRRLLPEVLAAHLPKVPC
jgi:predicted N-formylglutamate amidohydrolase